MATAILDEVLARYHNKDSINLVQNHAVSITSSSKSDADYDGLIDRIERL